MNVVFWFGLIALTVVGIAADGDTTLPSGPEAVNPSMPAADSDNATWPEIRRLKPNKERYSGGGKVFKIVMLIMPWIKCLKLYTQIMMMISCAWS